MFFFHSSFLVAELLPSFFPKLASHLVLMIITWRYWIHPEWLLHAPVYVSGTGGPISCLADQMKELVSAGVKLTPCPSPIFSLMIPPRRPPASSKHPSQPQCPPPPLPSWLHHHLLSPPPNKVERVDNVACAHTAQDSYWYVRGPGCITKGSHYSFQDKTGPLGK